MRWLALALALAIAGPAWGQASSAAGPSTPLTPAPDDRAKQWLSLVDDANYAEAWRQAAAYLREHESQPQFIKSVGGVRRPMGAMSSRALKDVKLVKTLPGMRDGQYAVVRFDSSFAHKAAAIESVTLVLENGAWSVIGYHIE